MFPHAYQLLAAVSINVATCLFYLFALLTGAAAVGVVVSSNIVRMAVCLLFALVGVAGLYFLLDAEFLAAVQLVVYVGGTLILIVFGVMLTHRTRFPHAEASPTEIIVAVSVGALLLAGIILALTAARIPSVDASQPVAEYRTDRLGQALLGDYLLPFEIVSVLLLVVMIGAAYLAKSRRRTGDGRVDKADRRGVPERPAV